MTVSFTNRLLGAAANLEASLSCYPLLVSYSQIYILDSNLVVEFNQYLSKVKQILV